MNGTEPIRVALADDHTMVRKGLVAMLSADERFEVVADAGNGKELLTAINAVAYKPDVCLLDINMPVMDGHETLVALKEAYPLMKCLVLSMNDHEFTILKMLRSGANGYLLKENEPNELKRAIEYIYTHELYHSDLVDKHFKTILKRNDFSNPGFTEAEEEVLRYCCTEMSYRDMADVMHKSVRTVEGYRNALFEKIGTNTRIGLMIFALKTGIGRLDDRQGPAA